MLAHLGRVKQVRPVDHFAAFCETLTQSEDRWEGQPLKLEPWQRRFWREALDDRRSGRRLVEIPMTRTRSAGLERLPAKPGRYPRQTPAKGAFLDNCPPRYSAVPFLSPMGASEPRARRGRMRLRRIFDPGAWACPDKLPPQVRRSLSMRTATTVATDTSLPLGAQAISGGTAQTIPKKGAADITRRWLTDR